MTAPARNGSTPTPAPTSVYGIKLPARVAVTTDDDRSFLVDMTAAGTTVEWDGNALFLTIRAKVFATNQAARDGLDPKGAIDP